MLPLVAVLFFVIAKSYDWTEATTVLKTAIDDGAFPGYSALVAHKGKVLLRTAFGKFTYYPKNGDPPPLNNGTNPRVSVSTVWDMASCSKVMATTTAAAILYQQGHLDIYAPVSRFLGPRYEQNGKANVTVLNCLLHNAGYPPDPAPGYWQDTSCPNNKFPHPPQDFACSHVIYERLLAQTLDAPINSVYVYSDLSFITLSYVVGSVAYSRSLVSRSDLLPSCEANLHKQPNSGLLYLCYFEAYVRMKVFGSLGLKHTRYLPLPATWSLLPPTRIDTWYRHAPSQGYVDDENAYAMGGISGHAGVFSNLDDIFILMQAWMSGTREDLLNSTTVRLWRKEYNHTQSSRALGWNTNDPNAPDRGWNLTCGHLSPTTFLHLGYTGTQICADPENEILTLLLTNRVYPTGSNTKIQRVRQLWNDAVAKQFKLKDNAARDEKLIHV